MCLTEEPDSWVEVGTLGSGAHTPDALATYLHLQPDCIIDSGFVREQILRPIAEPRARSRRMIMANVTLRAQPGAALSSEQLVELRQRLSEARASVVARVSERLALAAPLESRHPDEMDEAATNQDLAILFRLVDKEQKLVAEIDAALARLDEGTYGLCAGTGEPIGYRRLLARPWTRFSVEYKETLEREQARPGQ